MGVAYLQGRTLSWARERETTTGGWREPSICFCSPKQQSVFSHQPLRAAVNCVSAPWESLCSPGPLCFQLPASRLLCCCDRWHCRCPLLLGRGLHEDWCHRRGLLGPAGEGAGWEQAQLMVPLRTPISSSTAWYDLLPPGTSSNPGNVSRPPPSTTAIKE